MNCNVPTDVCFSFTGFHHRGGRTDEHDDGWGIAFYEGRGCRLFMDTKPAAESPLAALVKSYPIRSLNVIAHIRKATVGAIAPENTHPFVREMWGRYWAFAHNGTLRNFQLPAAAAADRRFLPVGETDSERAFCHILHLLSNEFPSARPNPADLYRVLASIARELRSHGDFNFLLSNGELLFAHCSTRLAYIVRKAPFTTAHLVDEDYEVDFSLVTTPEDRVAVIATAPLTDNEDWVSMQSGGLVMFRDGVPVIAG